MKTRISIHRSSAVLAIALVACGAAMITAAEEEFPALVKRLQEEKPSFAKRQQALLMERYDLADTAKYLTYGASPRATIGLIEGARALALMRGRRYALPEDMADLVPDVLRHRIALSYEALSEGITPDAIVKTIMAKVAAPAKPISHYENHAAQTAPVAASTEAASA